MLEPVKLIAMKCPRATVSPIANGPAALASGLFGSQTPQTIKTRTKPEIIE